MARSISVKLVSPLVDVEFPVLALLSQKSGQGTAYFVASAVPASSGALDYYFVVKVGKPILKKYLRGQCDLRYLFTFAALKKYYTVSAKEFFEEKVKLQEYENVPTETQLPAPHFFSTSHNVEYGLEAVAEEEQTLYIDGEWQMPEFGDFYQRYSDIYAFNRALRELDDVSVTASRKAKIVNAFQSKPFKGGSSYLGFFSDLSDLVPYGDRPMLESIQYASPGKVEIKGRADAFEAIQSQIQLFLDNFEKVRDVHKELRDLMQVAGLLKINGRVVAPSAEVLAQVRAHAENLLRLFADNCFDVVFSSTHQNIVVTAKVALALFRRLLYTSSFFAQGRMSYEKA